MTPAAGLTGLVFSMYPPHEIIEFGGVISRYYDFDSRQSPKCGACGGLSHESDFDEDFSGIMVGDRSKFLAPAASILWQTFFAKVSLV